DLCWHFLPCGSQLNQQRCCPGCHKRLHVCTDFLRGIPPPRTCAEQQFSTPKELANSSRISNVHPADWAVEPFMAHHQLSVRLHKFGQLQNVRELESPLRFGRPAGRFCS